MISETTWWGYQRFKSKIAGVPLSYDIMLTDGRLLKVVFFNGEVLNRNSYSSLFSLRWRTSIITLDIPLWELQSFNSNLKETIELLTKLGVAERVYETHPYHKLKNPAIIGYKEGPGFSDFISVFSDEPKFIYENDILNQEKEEPPKN